MVLTTHIVKSDMLNCYFHYIVLPWVILIPAAKHLCTYFTIISILVLGVEPMILFQTVRHISVFHVDCFSWRQSGCPWPGAAGSSCLFPSLSRHHFCAGCDASWFSLQPDIGRSVVRCLLRARGFATIGKLCPPSSVGLLARQLITVHVDCWPKCCLKWWWFMRILNHRCLFNSSRISVFTKMCVASA
jgi:hypothetical protein